MPDTTPSPRPSRRGVMSLAAVLPLAVLPVAPVMAGRPDPDAELIALCAEFDRLEAEWEDTDTDAPVGDAAREAARDAHQDRLGTTQREIAERMHAIRATTAAGQAARARSLVRWAPDLMETSDTIEAMLRSAIYRDLTGIPTTAAPPIQFSEPVVPPEDVDHDKALMAVCRQHIEYFEALEADPRDADDTGPLWDAYLQTKRAIDVAKPRTLAGIYAKARVTKMQEVAGADPGWAADIVDDLLRLAGEA